MPHVSRFALGIAVVSLLVAGRGHLSVDGWVLHENFFGPAVELDVRDQAGLIL